VYRWVAHLVAADEKARVKDMIVRLLEVPKGQEVWCAFGVSALTAGRSPSSSCNRRVERPC
jgi:hypothetical protein